MIWCEFKEKVMDACKRKGVSRNVGIRLYLEYLDDCADDNDKRPEWDDEVPKWVLDEVEI